MCTGLKETWIYMATDTVFPVKEGTILTVSCNEGYQLDGDKHVTCIKDTEFSHTSEPKCGKKIYAIYAF